MNEKQQREYDKKWKIFFKTMTNEQYQIANKYLSYEMQKLIRICHSVWGKEQDKCNMEHQDLYDDAIKVLFESIRSYDSSKNIKFETYLRNNILLSYREWIRNNKYRAKRNNLLCDSKGRIVKNERGQSIVIANVSFDAPTDDGTDLKEKIALDDDFDKDELSAQMLDYLNNLSKAQRMIVTYLANGYKREDIITILHIDEKLYNDSLVGIRNNPKLKYLRILHRR